MPTLPDFRPHYEGKNALITGGIGFIGSNLAHRLVELGANVLLVDSLIADYGGNLFNIHDIQNKVRVNIADVRDEHGLRYLVRDQDYIFNLAGQVSHTDSMINPYTDLEINARSQLSILEACRYGNPTANIIFASTRQIYGRPEYLPVDERHPLQPVDINGINKMAGEWYHIVYHQVYGLKTVSLRLTNCYGPRMRVKDARQTFLGWWLRQLVEGNPLQIFGDGLQVRDFNYVDDVVNALLLVGFNEAANGQIYNLGGDDPINLKDLAEIMIEVYGRGRYEIIPFPEERKKIDIGDFYGDYRKIRSKLGWRPRVPLREGVARSLAYYEQHLAHYT
ncbi:MAG: NAD-dependent epimerase/dehydratase family protein [Anaerolineae bacterium]|nr:NAD-dependent epimerase/dehydratase family protein [Anaerolineae bacterium]